jgi:hypothetical protein
MTEPRFFPPDLHVLPSRHREGNCSPEAVHPEPESGLQG